jgi:hypothetical protein
MAYAYNCTSDDALNNTIFINYKIINRSTATLDSVYIGNWTDFDIGSPSDDFIGCDVKRGAFYGYNGDAVDDNSPLPNILTYGANPPAMATVFLKGPNANAYGYNDDNANVPASYQGYHDGIAGNERLGMSKFMYFLNDDSFQGDPHIAWDYYNYLNGKWKNGSPLTYTWSC